MRMSVIVGMASVVFLALPDLVWAKPLQAPNVAEVDLSQTFACPTGGNYQDIPDLTLTLETFGGPVLLTVTLNFRANPAAGIDFFPVIDGQASNEGRLQRFIGDFSGQIALLPFTRVYELAPGVHTFGVLVGCQNQILMDRGWLIAYELPPVKPLPK
jgi:hypothetical protein